MDGERLVQLPPVPFGLSALRRAISEIDGHLSRKQNVQAFSEDPACILRFAPTLADRTVRLSDGVVIAPGDPVVDIHCWNERVPAMPKGGPDLAWALKASGGLRASLRLLAGAMDGMPALCGARAIRAKVNFVGRGGSNESVTRIIHRLGFEDVDESRHTLVDRLHGAMHDTFENLLIGALVWTHNPEALRRDKMLRERRPVWCSRERLMTLHGKRQ